MLRILTEAIRVRICPSMFLCIPGRTLAWGIPAPYSNTIRVVDPYGWSEVSLQLEKLTFACVACVACVTCVTGHHCHQSQKQCRTTENGARVVDFRRSR